jgi:ABC-type nitrate/sulfonate/bicarbonate transport system permease component
MKFAATAWAFLGSLLFIIAWYALKKIANVPDRVLPSIEDTFGAINDISPSIWIHTLSTVQRLVIGFILGTCLGITLGIFLFKSKIFFNLVNPTIQSFRAVPPIATVPFFILWFGFSETGRYVMVFSGISFNIAVATFQILRFIPEKYKILFESFGNNPAKMVRGYIIPRVVEELLPTIRFSFSVAVGMVIVSELLGAQVGLGYLIQTSRSTYSMHVIFLCMIILGLINFLFDKLITYIWQRLSYWKK